PAPPDASKAAPDRLPPSATDMSEGPARVNREMSGAQVTERQLKRANEPTFTRALGDKKAAERHSATAPRQLRRHEADELRTTTADAQRSGATAMGAMAAQRVTTGQGVGSGKGRAKSRDEEKRAQVTALLQGVFDTMKKDVESILEGLEKRVDDQFTRGEKEARDAFTAEHRRKMEEYKDRRYSGVIGKFRWIRDLFVGLPAEADRIFDDARAGYLRRMRQVISDVATTIGSELDRAKRRIAQGRTELQAAVRRLPTDLRAIGAEAATEFQGRFDDLAQSVDDKATQLVDTLADKYTEALKSVDAEIAKEREKNQGLVQKAVKAIISVIDTIRELGRLLGAVLAKAAGAVMMILRDPIGFLGNLVRGVGAGLRQFQQNIGRHLQQGIMSWLLGRATEAGLQLPEKFDARGVFTLLAGLLGLTWASIRARITRRVPEAAVAAAESAVPLVAAVRRQGIAGLWDDIRARVGDLRKTLVDKVIDYVVPTLVVAGIAWILSLLNPASAFVRAVKLIIDVITFIVTQARQVIAFMNAVLDAVIAIAKGGAGGVPGLVERALAGSIPLLLGFLAALLGIGGIAARVRQIVQAMARPVQMAVDWVVDRIVGLVQRLWRSLKAKGTSLGRGKAAGQGPGGGSGRGRGKDSGRDSSSGRDKDRGKGKDKDKGKDADAQRKRLTKAMAAAVSAVNRFRGRVVGKFALNALFPLIRRRYGLTSLTAVEKGGFWAVRGVINPVATEMTQAQVLGEMKAYQKQHQDSTFTAAEKAELTQLMKDLEGGKFTKEAAHKKFKELIERSRARREKYVAAEMSEEKRHTVPEKSGKEMDKIEAERQRLKGLREPENKERTQLAKKMGHNNPDKVDRAALAEQRRLGNAKDVDAFEKADKKYKELGTELTGESEKLGMHAAEDFARSKGGVDFYKGAPGKAGTLDLVKLKPGNPPTLIICEAKGGSSTLGTRAIGGQDYQQGRPEYLEWMLKNDKDFHKAAEEHGLLQRIKNRELPVEYYLVTASGGRNVTVREFKK
ncbi:HPC2 multi-domain protein, partial [Streptomyces clavuligerus]